MENLTGIVLGFRTRAVSSAAGHRAMTEPVVHSHPEIVSGEPVFVGTRVPARNLVEWLVAGHTLGEFLDNFSSVTRDQAIRFLEQATESALPTVPQDAAHARLHETNEGTMKKTQDDDAADEMGPEYDFRGGVRGKYAARYASGTNVVLLEPDVAKVFRDPAAVNRALRALAGIIRDQQAPEPG
jgi:uncharacterized protein (DUF433 family)